MKTKTYDVKPGNSIGTGKTSPRYWVSLPPLPDWARRPFKILLILIAIGVGFKLFGIGPSGSRAPTASKQELAEMTFVQVRGTGSFYFLKPNEKVTDAAIKSTPIKLTKDWQEISWKDDRYRRLHIIPGTKIEVKVNDDRVIKYPSNGSPHTNTRFINGSLTVHHHNVRFTEKK